MSRSDATPYGRLNSLWEAIRLLNLPRGLLSADCVSVGDEPRTPGAPDLFLRVSKGEVGPYLIAVDDTAGVFRWVSGPDTAGQVGPLSDPGQAARAIALLFGLEPPRRGRPH